MSDPKLPECDDVEITPEMIEAGARAILQFTEEQLLDDHEGVAEAVFTAMMRQRLQSSTKAVAQYR